MHIYFLAIRFKKNIRLVIMKNMIEAIKKDLKINFLTLINNLKNEKASV